MSGPEQQQTEPWAQRLLAERWRRMSPTDKLDLMSQHSIALQELSKVGLRLRFPAADEEEIELRAAALRIGPEVFARVTGRRFSWD